MTVSQDILKKMMELPHRLSGTVYEQKAGEYLKNVYSYFGIQAKEFNSSTLPNSLELHLIISFSLMLLTILVNFLNIALITLPIFVVTVLVYFRLFNLPFRFFKKRTQSKNIYAEVPASGKEKYTLIFTSHYDTSNDLGPLWSILGPIHKYLNGPSGFNLPDYINNALVFPNLALGLTLLALFIPDNSAKFFFGIFAAIPLVIGIYFLNNGKKKPSSGAYDNGAGTSLMVELAAYFNKNPLNSTKLIFANVAAANTLTRGTIPFLNSLNLEKLNTFIVDLDGIGEEQFVLVDSEPSYPLGLAVPFDSTFQVVADFADDFFQKDYKIINSPLPSGNQELIMRGYRVSAIITTMPKNNYPKAFHSSKDNFENIKWDKVEEVRDFIIGYSTYFDEVSKEVNF